MDAGRAVSPPMRWQCARGHRWTIRAAEIRIGRWCGVCAYTFAGTIDGMRARAGQLGGKCLSTEYDDPRRPLRWQCRVGHRFEALAKTVKSGVWCPKCPPEVLAAPPKPRKRSRSRATADARLRPPGRPCPSSRKRSGG